MRISKLFFGSSFSSTYPSGISGSGSIPNITKPINEMHDAIVNRARGVK